MKYVPATVGLVSGLGKGVRASSVGVILKACGLGITSIKIDPYLNASAGTTSPFKHGESFVLDDSGGQVDLDVGNCERFLDIELTRNNSGKIFQSLIDKERKGEYLGKTVQDCIEPVAMIAVDGMDGPADVIKLDRTIGGHEFNTEDVSAPLLNGRHQSLIRQHSNEKGSHFPLSKGSLPAQLLQARKVLPCSPLRFVSQHGGAAVLHRALRGLCTGEAPFKAPPEPISLFELDTISSLIPRLLSEGHVPAAGRLLSAVLLLPGSPERLLFSPLAEHLASLPTLTPAFALLTTLRHHPVRPSALPLATPLLVNLLSMRRARDAASVLRWLCRPDSSCRPDDATYDIAVAGFCRIEDTKSVLVTLREMALDGVRPSQKLQEAVRDAMLQDSRIEEAWALEETMQLPESTKTVELVDKFLGAWEE
ncbi:uncharacterized protein [Lolium perenne]|uniref:uncharacterized protein n=1 Tax=Lolium perenne TaxID=4522 RepID=UPI0021EADA99|nr:uncharacterized protein LOC127342955 isoform X1 [Lolium perenne]XP_051224979.1 uncharacterized protein LOC127342955 isoform X1 [Lolium perenne]